MGWLNQLFSRGRLYSDLSEETREHLKEKSEELVAGSISRREAAALAPREFGNVTLTEQDSREVWRWPPIENLLMDVRFGANIMRKSPDFTSVAVLTLALGIETSTAIFSLLNPLIFGPLNLPEPNRLVRIFSGRMGASYLMSYPNYLDLRGSVDRILGAWFRGTLL